jgi:hypothetical protein
MILLALTFGLLEETRKWCTRSIDAAPGRIELDADR